MVKFTRVTDPERVKDGDLLVFPAGETRLNLKPSTFADLGLSIGDTTRSDNSAHTVEAWLYRPDCAARCFMLCEIQGKMPRSGNDLLLSMDACTVRKDPEVPRVLDGAIVPFGPKLWSWEKWAGCWNETFPDAMMRAFGARVGVAGAISTDACKAHPEDAYANLVWDDGSWKAGLDSRDEAWDEAGSFFPFQNGRGKVDGDSFDISSLMDWDGGFGWGRKSDRIRFRCGFLAELARRGAKVLRPGAGFAELVTESVVSWYCGAVRRRFEARVAACRKFMKGLADDVRRDLARARMYGTASYKAGRKGPGLARALLKGTGAAL